MALDLKEQRALIRMLPLDLKLSETEYLTEEAFLEALAQKVSYMLQYDSGVFFQLLYKMDVLEPKLNQAMHTADVPMSIAKLILERKLESLAARKANPAKTTDDLDLSW